MTIGELDLGWIWCHGELERNWNFADTIESLNTKPRPCHTSVLSCYWFSELESGLCYLQIKALYLIRSYTVYHISEIRLISDSGPPSIPLWLFLLFLTPLLLMLVGPTYLSGTVGTVLIFINIYFYADGVHESHNVVLSVWLLHSLIFVNIVSLPGELISSVSI